MEGEQGTMCQCNPCLCDDTSGKCICDPCFCDTPPGGSPLEARSQGSLHPEDEPLPYIEISNLGRGFTLDEFIRAKEYFMIASTKSGLSVYDHLSEVIRKLLDERNPPNIVDFMEEISLNIKRYRFGMNKEVVKDAHYISPPVLADALQMVNSWKKHALWSVEQAEIGGEGKPSFGGFPNLMRLLYYLEQVNVGLPREEMFRVALAIRELSMSQPLKRARFWGKVFGVRKSYYVLEVELKGDAPDLEWQPPPETPEIPDIEPTNAQEVSGLYVPGAGATFMRAGGAVTDPDILTPYQETSGLPPGATSIGLPKPLPTDEKEFYGEGPEIEYDDPEAAAEVARWEQYQNELMTGLPVAPNQETITVPPETKKNGLNRRTFYVCSELGDEWIRLPDVTPQQINSSRTIRWHLSGTINNKLTTFPEFPGREGNYLRALLARATAGSQVSPRGYFKTSKYGEFDGEDDDDETVDDEEEETITDDTVHPVKKFHPPPMSDLLNANMESWVHHTSHILRQGRVSWWNPARAKKEVTEEDDEEVEEEEEEDDEAREFGPNLFASLSEDKTFDGTAPWSTRPSSSVFTEFQVVSARSNLWPGATSICTIKGKVENVYFGDGLKFAGRTYSPAVPEETQTEYVVGPELNEITDPTVEEEQAWLAKLQLDEIADIEDKFVDNELEEEEESDED